MKLIKHFFIILALLFATHAVAEPVQGKDYQLLSPPLPTNSGTKIEVLEFFFYECPHCFHLHPLLAAWEKNMPKDVELTFVPTIFRDSTEPLARTFYTLEAMGQIKQLDDEIYHALHVENLVFNDMDSIANFLAKHGVDRAKFVATYNSFSIGSKILRSKQMVRNYGINGTPTLVVDGKYTITGLRPEDAIKVLSAIVDKARKEHSAK